MQIGDASKGIACWLYTNKKHGDQCVQFVQGLMPLDHWTEQPLGVLADAPGGDVERVATSAEIAQVRQAAINEGLEMAAKVAEEWFPADTAVRYPAGGVVASIRAMKVEK